MQTIFDFTQPISNYRIVTDSTERKLGKSHGTLSYKDSIVDKKSYFFANLDPQPNGAAFVSIIIDKPMALNSKQNLCLDIAGLQDKAVVMQLLLITPEARQQQFSYQHKFLLEAQRQKFCLPISDFVAYYRGEAYPAAPILRPEDIQAFGIRIIGRDKDPQGAMQSGLYAAVLYSLTVDN